LYARRRQYSARREFVLFCHSFGPEQQEEPSDNTKELTDKGDLYLSQCREEREKYSQQKLDQEQEEEFLENTENTDNTENTEITEDRAIGENGIIETIANEDKESSQTDLSDFHTESGKKTVTEKLDKNIQGTTKFVNINNNPTKPKTESMQESSIICKMSTPLCTCQTEIMITISGIFFFILLILISDTRRSFTQLKAQIDVQNEILKRQYELFSTQKKTN